MKFYLFIREGVQEILKELSKFCTFYVYSKGYEQYIQKILSIIDPMGELFLDRQNRVIATPDGTAPENNKTPKSITHFKCLSPDDY